MAKRTSEPRDRYFQVHYYMVITEPWKALSAQARAIYIQIGSRYTGSNNGRIAFSVREAAEECNIAKDTASRAFKELITLGFIEETRHGGLCRKTPMASEWRLTAFRCDLTGTSKTCLFMQRVPAARDHRLSQNRDGACPKRLPRVSQKTAQSVPNEVH